MSEVAQAHPTLACGESTPSHKWEGLSEDKPLPLVGGVGVGLPANPHRGEASIRVGAETLVLRPSFSALVAAEGELGSLFALVERAAEGGIRVAEIVALFWHCLVEPPVDLTRERLGEAVASLGLRGVMPAVTTLLRQVMLGA